MFFSEMRTLLLFFVTLLLGLAPAVDAGAATQQEWRFSGVGKVVAVGDVHGAYDELVNLLQDVGVLSSNLEWSGGSTWLVMLGDLVDRGPRSRDVVDLIMHLQSTAPESGGRVLVVLGNHDVMFMLGQLLYASVEDFAAFAPDENVRERKRAFKKYGKRHQGLGPTVSREEFDSRFPPGSLALRRGFSIDGEYGRWLLDQHILIVIDDTVFVHGGIPPILADYGPEEINTVAIDELRTIMKAQKLLAAANVFGAETDYDDQVRPAESFVEKMRNSRRPRIRRRVAAAETVAHMSDALAVSSVGPLWYRGISLHPQYKEDGRATAMLAHLGVDRVVMGHTPSDDGRVQVRLDGRAVMADTGMLAREFSGQASALIVDDGRISAYYPGEELVRLPDPAPRSMIEKNIARAYEEALMSADIVKTRPRSADGHQERQLELVHEKNLLRAVFITNSGGVESDDEFNIHRFQHEIAAYRVDRFLGFGLVPPTVRRSIEGEVGAVQFRPDNTLSGTEIREGDGGPAAASSVRRWEILFQAFDCMINNPDRDPDSILWGVKTKIPYLTEHGSAFAPVSGRMSCPSAADLDGTTANLLRSLDFEQLRGELSGLLGAGRLDALMRRIDGFVQGR